MCSLSSLTLYKSRSLKIIQCITDDDIPPDINIDRHLPQSQLTTLEDVGGIFVPCMQTCAEMPSWKTRHMEEEERRREYETIMEELRRICNDDIYEYIGLEIREVEGPKEYCVCYNSYFFWLSCAHMSPGKWLNYLGPIR